MKRVLAVGVALAFLAACGGGGTKKTASANTTAPPAPVTTAFSAEAAKADITALYTTFFSDKTTTDQAVKLLENGEEMRAAIDLQRTSGAANGITAAVKTIQLQNTELADVRFDIVLKGAVVAPNTAGQAKYIGGSWKINQQLFCTLIGLAGQHPAPCAKFG
jgi:hypothetical protein